jgi:predicted DNA-binding transcriptional regulator YafY
MKTRRDMLLGIVAGATGFGVLSSRAFAWYYEELTPGQAAALAAACRSSANFSTDSHADLIAVARQDLLQRIAQGQLPANASEQVGCPLCGCSFVVTADGTN